MSQKRTPQETRYLFVVKYAMVLHKIYTPFSILGDQGDNAQRWYFVYDRRLIGSGIL